MPSLFNRPAQRLREIMRAPTVGPAEMILALTAVAYGIGLLLPREEFYLYRIQGAMASTLSETVWGLMFTVVGSLRIASILWKSYRVRTWTTLISIGLWLYLGVSFALATPLNPRVTVLFVWALCESWTLLRIHRRE